MSQLVGDTAVPAHCYQIRAEFFGTSQNLICRIALGSELMVGDQSLVCERRIRCLENPFGFKPPLDFEPVSFLGINAKSFEKRYKWLLHMKKIDFRSFGIDDEAEPSGCLERAFGSIHRQQHPARSRPVRRSQFGSGVQSRHSRQRISRKQLQRRLPPRGQMPDAFERKIGTANGARQAVAANYGPMVVVGYGFTQSARHSKRTCSAGFEFPDSHRSVAQNRACESD